MNSQQIDLFTGLLTGLLMDRVQIQHPARVKPSSPVEAPALAQTLSNYIGYIKYISRKHCGPQLSLFYSFSISPESRLPYAASPHY